MNMRSFFRYLLGQTRRFGRSDGGMTLPLLALSLIAVTGMVGVAIDTGRAQLVQSKLQFSLDAAGLAAGSTVSTSALNSEVTKYLTANFNGYLGATMTNTGATVDGTNTIITLTATATLPTTFMGVVNVNTITVGAHTQISRAVTGLELVMVLDNTGSMNNSAGGSVSKIQALKTAANTLVSTLFAGNPPAGKLWVGIVPFSQAVNIGTSHPTWLNTTYDTALATMPASQGPGWGPTSWVGCVDSRSNGEDVTDDPPVTSNTQTLFNQYYWPSDNLTYGPPYYNTPNSNYNRWAFPATYNMCVNVNTYKRCQGSNCSNVSPTCLAGSGITCTPVTPTCSTVSSCTANSTTTCTPLTYTYSSPLNTLNKGPNLLCPQQVTPMTNVSSTLTTAINSMTAQGDTLINQGLEWGWNMISPRWRGIWGGTMDSNNLPLDYGTQGMQKAIVLLTDGENTIDNTSHGAYWFVENNQLGTTSSSTAITTLNSRTLQLCTAMKNKGIYIYTIALGTDTTPTSLSLLQSCATAQNYYFNSPSTTQLQSIFSAIGDSLSNLRISK